MRLKPADTKQDMFVQVHVTLERGSKMFSHVPSSASPIYTEHEAIWLPACGHDHALWHGALLQKAFRKQSKTLLLLIYLHRARGSYIPLYTTVTSLSLIVNCYVSISAFSQLPVLAGWATKECGAGPLRRGWEIAVARDKINKSLSLRLVENSCLSLWSCLLFHSVDVCVSK